MYAIRSYYEEDLLPVLEQGSGLKAGEGFYLAFSPEREDPGRTDHSVKTIPKVMGGYTPACLERCVELYSKAVEHPYPVKSCRIAEATKLTENIVITSYSIHYTKLYELWDLPLLWRCSGAKAP